MDIRTLGLGMVGVGGTLQVAGFGLDAALHGADPGLAAREGTFTLTNPGHLLVYAGIGLILTGVALAIAGPRLYQPSRDHEIRRRLLQFGTPLAAFVLLVGGGYAANASTGAREEAEVETAGAPMAAGSGHAHADGEDHAHADGAGHDDHGDAGHAEGDHAEHADGVHDDHAEGDHAADASHAHATPASTGGHQHGDGAAHDDGSGHDDHGDSTGGTDDGHDHEHAGGPTTTVPGGGHDDHGAHDHGSSAPTTTVPGGGHDDHSGHGDHGTPTTTVPGGGHDDHDGGHDHGGGGTASECPSHSHGEPDQQVPLDPAMQATVDAQLAEARTYALQFPTARDAYNAGYRQVTHYYCGIGAHWLKIPLLNDGFNPAAPDILLYDADGLDAKIVGVNYYVVQDGLPEGFPGSADMWHQHIGLCLKIFFVIGPESWTDEQCKAAGGMKQRNPHRYWLLHAWIIPGYEHPTNVFAPSLPSLPVGPWDDEHVSF